jgi:curved DNA-binding protein CbpA
MTPDYYTLLGVAPSAEDEIIRAAYLVLAKRYHPDTASAASTDNVEKFRLIAEAYEVLRDPPSRAYYDWSHAREKQKVASQIEQDHSQQEQQHREMRAARSGWSSAINNPLVYSAGAVALFVAVLLGLTKMIATHGPSGSTDVAMRTEKSEQSSSLLREPAALQELSDLRRTLHQTERLAATNQEALERERFRSQELGKQLAARGDNEKLLAQERVRSLELEQQLAARGDSEKLLAQEHARSAGLEQQLTVPRHASPARQYSAIASPSDTVHRTSPPATGDAATSLLPTRDTPVIPAADNSATVGRPQAPSNPEAARLMARGRVLLDQGNIAVARNVLERAAEMGSAPALFALAETYDPAMLSAWGTLGTQGDVGKAQELYAKAFASGVRPGKDR